MRDAHSVAFLAEVCSRRFCSGKTFRVSVLVLCDHHSPSVEQPHLHRSLVAIRLAQRRGRQILACVGVADAPAAPHMPDRIKTCVDLLKSDSETPAPDATTTAAATPRRTLRGARATPWRMVGPAA